MRRITPSQATSLFEEILLKKEIIHKVIQYENFVYLITSKNFRCIDFSPPYENYTLTKTIKWSEIIGPLVYDNGSRSKHGLIEFLPLTGDNNEFRIPKRVSYSTIRNLIIRLKYGLPLKRQA